MRPARLLIFLEKQGLRMGFRGRLEDLRVSEILEMLALGRKSGLLVLESPKDTARILFRRGQIQYASLDRSPRLGERLVAKGVLSPQEVERALRIQRECRGRDPLATILRQLGVPARVLESTLQEQMRETIREVLGWTTGTFAFEAAPGEDSSCAPDASNRMLLEEGVSPEYLLLEGARVQDEDLVGFGQTQEEGPVWASPGGRPGSEKGIPLVLLQGMLQVATAQEIVWLVLEGVLEHLPWALILVPRGSLWVEVGRGGLPLPESRPIRLCPPGRSPWKAVLAGGTWRGELPPEDPLAAELISLGVAPQMLLPFSYAHRVLGMLVGPLPESETVQAWVEALVQLGARLMISLEASVSSGTARPEVGS